MSGPSDLAWVRSFLGLPYLDKGRTRDGIDCWGLPFLVYREVLAIDLPSYAEGYTTAQGDATERAEVAAVVGRATGSPLWMPAERARTFDIAVFRRGGLASHVGLVIRPGEMLHIEEASDWSRVESYDGRRWLHRLVGVFRHRQLAEAA